MSRGIVFLQIWLIVIMFHVNVTSFSFDYTVYDIQSSSAVSNSLLFADSQVGIIQIALYQKVEKEKIWFYWTLSANDSNFLQWHQERIFIKWH